MRRMRSRTAKPSFGPRRYTRLPNACSRHGKLPLHVVSDVRSGLKLPATGWNELVLATAAGAWEDGSSDVSPAQPVSAATSAHAASRAVRPPGRIRSTITRSAGVFYGPFGRAYSHSIVLGGF